MNHAKQPSKIKGYREWAEAWLDGTPWKTSFMEANPGNNYMEIDNYFVKTLVGWKNEALRGREIGSIELEKAKEILDSFDVVFKF